MRRTATLMLITVILTMLSASAVAAAPDEAPFPTEIDLPDGFFPEGIAIDGVDAFVGSLIDGSIRQQDLRTGETAEFASSPGPGKIAVGMDVDRWGRLWVAGGGPVLDPSIAPSFRVYDLATGSLLLEQVVAAGFVNDVVVSREAAWLTDSFSPSLIRVPLKADGSIGVPDKADLVGDWVQVAGFNANGIVVTPDDKHLIVAQSTAPDVVGAALYRVPVDGDASTLDAVRIQLDGVLAGADGLVLNGRTLYSVAGPAGVAKLRLSNALDEGRIVEVLEVPGSITPTTAALRGSRLYVVDAKFPLFGDLSVPFQTTAVKR